MARHPLPTFGIPGTVAAAMRIYEMASRGSGRTEVVLKAMDDGDVLLVGGPAGERERERCERLLHRMEKPGCSVITVPESRPMDFLHVTVLPRILDRQSKGWAKRVWLDHGLIFALHEWALLDMARGVAGFMERAGQSDPEALARAMRRAEVVPAAVQFLGRDFI